ncbi:hypothetical protein GeomeDRAFT_2411 [Geobacter metallireducens RCH3]|uniref:DUF507 family protein n=1 Tax=Geobacter metallireducens (strain ATCC 53774 / DSM 7210 / GS-15) TaxID=269799 RepID=Q39ZP9_GEOMG|nr:hypothetical protein Gmet_0025 [Geobacter metallireducens GS-15]EHP85591.1 hypothetical protein GeomeDRAFT_2411 [Geobacter metallireducens RCH3]
MKLKEAQIARLAEQVLERLITAGLINLKAERGVVLDRIKKAVASDAKGEEDLEREAERLLEQTLRSMGGGVGIDRHKMLKMIKERLAKEKGIVI